MVDRPAPEVRGIKLGQSSASLGLVILAAVVFSLPAPDVAAAELTRIDLPAKPAFVLQDLHGRPIALNSFKGRTVLVHFFATWCEPCREELPALNRLVARSDPSHLRVVSISVAEVDARVRNFVEKIPVGFPVLLDRDRSIAKLWGVSSLPTTFILDRHLRPRLSVERDYDWDLLNIQELQKSFGE